MQSRLADAILGGLPMARSQVHRASGAASHDPTYLVHFTRFQLGEREALSAPALRRIWSAECADREGYRGGLLVAFGEREWLEITVCDRPPPPSDSDGDAGACGGVADRIAGPSTEIVGQETGVLALTDPIAIDASGPVVFPSEGSRS